MATQLKFLLPLSIFAISFLYSSNAESCSSYTFSDKRAYKSCTDLPHLGAALYYNQATSSNNIDIAFRAPQSSSGWVAWGLNPKGPSMVGSQVGQKMTLPFFVITFAELKQKYNFCSKIWFIK
jgi:hypothetical protein